MQSCSVLLHLVLLSPWLCLGENASEASSVATPLEAVDLQAATGKASGPDQQKEMQDLLHWAIGSGLQKGVAAACKGFGFHL